MNMRRSDGRLMAIVERGWSDYHVVTVNLLERLSPSYWWADPNEPLSNPIYLVLAILLAIALVAAAFAWIAAPRVFADNRFRQRLITRIAVIVFSFAAVGLLLLLFRWQAVPFFSKRLWFVIWWVAAIGSAVYLVYYQRRIYPVRLAAWEDAERRRRYMPRPGSSARRPRRRSRRQR
jgi:hypothetical protein